jgi:hypothetical protein
MHRHIAASALAATLLAMPSAAQAQTPAASAETQVQKAQVARPASVTKAPVAPRAYIAVNAGYQGSPSRFSNTYTFPVYAEPASVTSTYASKAGMMFDVGGGVRVWRNLTFGAAISRYSHEDPIGVSAQVPHPFFFNQYRSTQGSSSGAARTETVIHVQAMWSIDASARTRIGLFAGPSRFAVTQAVVSRTNFTDTFPYDTVLVGSVITTNQSTSRVGYNVGTDVAYVLKRRRRGDIGVGGIIRFSRASVSFSDANHNTFSGRVGGLQVGAGVRLGF